MKLVIKESSIRNQPNLISLKMVKEELLKFLPELIFNEFMQQGNFMITETLEFKEEDFSYPNNLSIFKNYLGNILNFRYENFMIYLV